MERKQIKSAIATKMGQLRIIGLIAIVGLLSPVVAQAAAMAAGAPQVPFASMGHPIGDLKIDDLSKLNPQQLESALVYWRDEAPTYPGGDNSFRENMILGILRELTRHERMIQLPPQEINQMQHFVNGLNNLKSQPVQALYIISQPGFQTIDQVVTYGGANDLQGAPKTENPIGESISVNSTVFTPYSWHQGSHVKAYGISAANLQVNNQSVSNMGNLINFIDNLIQQENQRMGQNYETLSTVLNTLAQYPGSIMNWRLYARWKNMINKLPVPQFMYVYCNPYNYAECYSYPINAALWILTRNARNQNDQYYKIRKPNNSQTGQKTIGELLDVLLGVYGVSDASIINKAGTYVAPSAKLDTLSMLPPVLPQPQIPVVAAPVDAAVERAIATMRAEQAQAQVGVFADARAEAPRPRRLSLPNFGRGEVAQRTALELANEARRARFATEEARRAELAGNEAAAAARLAAEQQTARAELAGNEAAAAVTRAAEQRRLIDARAGLARAELEQQQQRANRARIAHAEIARLRDEEARRQNGIARMDQERETAQRAAAERIEAERQRVLRAEAAEARERAAAAERRRRAPEIPQQPQAPVMSPTRQAEIDLRQAMEEATRGLAR